MNYKNDTTVKPQAKQLVVRNMTLLDPQIPVLSTSEFKQNDGLKSSPLAEAHQIDNSVTNWSNYQLLDTELQFQI